MGAPSAAAARDAAALDLSGRPPDAAPARRIVVDDAAIATFARIDAPPGVEAFSCLRTPLAAYRHLALMAAIVFGPTLRRVNAAPIPPATRDAAAILAPLVRADLIGGAVLLNTRPIRLLNLATRRRRTVFADIGAARAQPAEGRTVFAADAPRSPPPGPMRDERLRQDFDDLSAALLRSLGGDAPPAPARSRKSQASARSRRSGRSSGLSLGALDLPLFEKRVPIP
jgi:hypothetical protein